MKFVLLLVLSMAMNMGCCFAVGGDGVVSNAGFTVRWNNQTLTIARAGGVACITRTYDQSVGGVGLSQTVAIVYGAYSNVLEKISLASCQPATSQKTYGTAAVSLTD